MTKKELEKKIADLEAKIADLTAAMLALSLRQNTQITYIPAPAPPLPVSPSVPVYPTYPAPYIGDPLPGTPGYPTITCGTNVQTSKGIDNFRVVQ
jgi:hypothetical protein